jgi:hypothetical protein
MNDDARNHEREDGYYCHHHSLGFSGFCHQPVLVTGQQGLRPARIQIKTLLLLLLLLLLLWLYCIFVYSLSLPYIFCVP